MGIEELIKSIKEKLNIKSVKAVIGKEKIKKIAIINGSGSSFFNLAYNKGADCIITGDTTYIMLQIIKKWVDNNRYWSL